MGKNDQIELSEARAMVYIPENAIEIEINATIYEDGKLVKVGKTMGLKEIQKAFKDAEDNYSEDSDEFVITEKGKEYLNSLKNEVEWSQ